MTRLSTTLFWLSLTILVSLGLYHTSYRVDSLGRQLRALNEQIEAEQRTIHVLKAEWVFLANPARLEATAKKHLDLKPTEPHQVAVLRSLKSMIPTRKETGNTDTFEAKPIASLGLRNAPHRLKAVAEETGRINTRLVIQKTAQAPLPTPRAPLQLAHDNIFELANTSDEQ